MKTPGPEGRRSGRPEAEACALLSRFISSPVAGVAGPLSRSPLCPPRPSTLGSAAPPPPWPPAHPLWAKLPCLPVPCPAPDSHLRHMVILWETMSSTRLDSASRTVPPARDGLTPTPTGVHLEHEGPKVSDSRGRSAAFPKSYWGEIPSLPSEMRRAATPPASLASGEAGGRLSPTGSQVCAVHSQHHPSVGLSTRGQVTCPRPAKHSVANPAVETRSVCLPTVSH